MEIHQKISMPNYQKLMTMVNRSIDQKLGLRNFDGRNGRIETGTVVTSRRGLGGIERGKEFAISGKQKGSVREETNAASGKTGMNVQNRHQKPLHSLSHQHKEVEVRLQKRTSEAGIHLGSSIDSRAKNFLKSICTKSPCDHWHPPKVNSISLNRDSNSSISAQLHTGRLKVNKQKTEKKKAADKGTVAMLKDARQLGFVFQDTEPLVSLSILRKSTKVLGPIRRVRFTRATQRLANIRENKGPSLGKAKVPHQRSPYAMKFEDGSQEESERQERCARGHKKILKLKETDKATFFSPTNEWCLPARGKRIC